ncbi:PAS domain S-box protein [Antarcticibacterium arcticum]|uniref:histidine kinase n=1 Tax=Antarcticibacterium arcticum TaxID=2585771 RepID=A0A5B8YLF3_9FLAO|nr:PAS domain S-box protein [Antarcticibacterium arcticum]QED36549.1 PAS domain S-box protein [Antarcticibacterium arcticum]
MKENYFSLHILVIEDHLGDYILIEDYLTEEHKEIELTRAASFLQAREILKNNLFDTILLDLSLPDSGDVEVLVKEVMHLAGRVPVIVLTGNSNKDYGVRTLSLGISDYLLKDELNPVQLSKSIFYSIERKKVENQLIESEKKYKNLFNHSPLPKFVLDLNSLNFLSVNRAATELYGYSSKEFLKMNVRDLWVKEETPKVEEKWKSQYKEWFQIALKHRKKNGEVISVEVTSNPINFDGKPARVSLIKDVTAQLQAEKALQHSEQRFKALVQDGSELVMILDFKGNLSYASPASQAVMGVNMEVLLKNNFFYLIHEEDIDQVKDAIARLNNQKRIQIPSYRIKTANNEWRWIETIVTNLCEDPAVNGIVANSRDITEFVNQERELIESLQRYNIVAKATSDTITDYDVVNDRMEYNEGIQNMFGYNPAQIGREGSWWDDKVHPDDKERVKQKTREVFKNKHNQLQIEYRFRCADGTYKHILDRSYLLKDEEGNPLRMIGSMQDISNLKNYIKTIENHNARLKEISWTQSHVVRAPLARIMGLIDLLQNHGEIEDRDHLMENIFSSAHELDAIIRKISNKAEHPAESNWKC